MKDAIQNYKKRIKRKKGRGEIVTKGTTLRKAIFMLIEAKRENLAHSVF